MLIRCKPFGEEHANATISKTTKDANREEDEPVTHRTEGN